MTMPLDYPPPPSPSLGECLTYALAASVMTAAGALLVAVVSMVQVRRSRSRLAGAGIAMTDQERSTAVNAIRQLRVIRTHALVSFGFCVAVAAGCVLARSFL